MVYAQLKQQHESDRIAAMARAPLLTADASDVAVRAVPGPCGGAHRPPTLTDDNGSAAGQNADQ
ncbi:hypothetical protein Scel_33180 [Streptomyces cellostaticus]|nr:hypothetical protein Scel_33180 [Streptomyces cellostaticus]